MVEVVDLEFNDEANTSRNMDTLPLPDFGKDDSEESSDDDEGG